MRRKRFVDRIGKSTHAMQVALYATYLSVASVYMVADARSLQEFLDIGYYAWAVLFFVGTAILFIGAVFDSEWIEVVGTIPTACAAVVYSVALIREPPYDNMLLGIGAAGWIGVNFWWLLIRFAVIYPNLGTYKRGMRR